MNEAQEEDPLAEFLPPWATGKAKSWTDIGAQLRTRDGRRIGNAVLIGNEQQQGLTFYQVVTDVGTLVHFTERELDEMFYEPVYTMDVNSHSGYQRYIAKSAIGNERDRFEAMYAAEGRAVNQPMPDFTRLAGGVYADMAIRSAYYWFNRQKLPDGWHLGGYLKEVVAAREAAQPESLDAWIDQLVARFGISDNDVCGAADLVKLGFDNLRTKIGEPGWSPTQFAESLVEALINDNCHPQAGANIAELKLAIEQRARALEMVALSDT